jgi:hypothetical protein
MLRQEVIEKRKKMKDCGKRELNKNLKPKLSGAARPININGGSND